MIFECFMLYEKEIVVWWKFVDGMKYKFEVLFVIVSYWVMWFCKYCNVVS